MWSLLYLSLNTRESLCLQGIYILVGRAHNKHKYMSQVVINAVSKIK